MKCLSETTVFGGTLSRYEHVAVATRCKMRFAIYQPPQALKGAKCPVVYWLSGLTCNEDNFMQKAGAQRIAAELGVILIAPDTSPRGESVPDVDYYDFGQGAGFYVNATQAPWNTHYRMYDYVAKELPELVQSYFPCNGRQSIMGHSMGGHGALVIGLRNQQQYCSISAFSPISNPMDCPWGIKAFTGYLGEDPADWCEYDAAYLLGQNGSELPILIDQGLADEFLEEQLKPENLWHVAEEKAVPLQYHGHESYDHSYYFIATFIEKHLLFHARHFGD
ncbi:S-formylglutathione hydrolase [Planctobacterium marinum]|uniref:S-formylglutathione hydrolase n=1 Tax=Planctobacterium marinum TaxID=1631968 RepID=A0AA48KP22_9ALTE|nr:S-formylglutathione hydrolase [Planctobacterium marinum]